ncbi:thiamine phosphate synthase [Slackia piriformis]|uniref:Thiamine-phosphate synthase n=1 Tax=Slackia piriformis YIT 12062 TaxID=742818 RepID=K0YJL7_9ACTN|nr:thiamine phosphate synthase [Slackia piriformis]EJZ83576.1 thiamine-phosphate pyrophosphorylase [Slackia piriformis YIT 12062]
MQSPREYLRCHPEALRLYAVTDASWLGGRTLDECVLEAAEGGATFVQLRDKRASTSDLVEQCGRLRRVIPGDVPFVINDDLEAALVAQADGVHVGQSDAACEEARRVLGPEKIVGVSVQTVDQALAASEAGADYLGVGALFKTATKPEAADVCLATLSDICRSVDIPVVAIGGLNEKTVAALEGTGVAGAAVVSALFAASDIRQAARGLKSAIDRVI